MIFILWLSLSTANFFYALLVTGNYSAAFEQSWFQGAAFLLVYLVIKFGPSK